MFGTGVPAMCFWWSPCQVCVTFSKLLLLTTEKAMMSTSTSLYAISRSLS